MLSQLDLEFLSLVFEDYSQNLDNSPTMSNRLKELLARINIQNKNKLHHIKSQFSEDIRGCGAVDLLTLQDNRVIGINNEYICLYKNIDAFWESRPENTPTIDL